MMKYDHGLKTHARTLRQRMTDAEQVLWSRLRRKQVHGVQFYRQKPVGSYIVDFYAASARLVVELDGSQHFEQKHAQRDASRDGYLQRLGLQVLRFNNLQVLRELDAVLGEIARVVDEGAHKKQIQNQNQTLNPPCPPFTKGGSKPPSMETPSFKKEKRESLFTDTPLLEKGKEKSCSTDIPPFEKGGLGGICGSSSLSKLPGEDKK